MSQTKEINKHHIRAKLEKHHAHVVREFHKKHGETIDFAKKHSVNIASAAIMTAAAFDAQSAYKHQEVLHKQQQEQNQIAAGLESFITKLNSLLAEKDYLNAGEENVIAQALSSKFKLNLKVSLEGNRLNEIVGYVGKEQHLRRWAGDDLSKHSLQAEGMAPNQGSFKDFDNAEQEKYYVAVQLHELPDWNSNWSTLKPWYRYRKVFVYNPVNQKAIIAVIGDSGPAKFTGKTFGGSPEVMDYLEMKDGGEKGKAIVLFVDDTENKIALGPVNQANSYLASLENER